MFILENIKEYKDKKRNQEIIKVNILVVTTEFFYINIYFILLPASKIILYGCIETSL